MPVVSIYPAYSAATDADARSYTYEVPEKVTGLQVKRLAGHDQTSWLYVRLRRHDYRERCKCYACIHYKAGWWRPLGWQKDRRPTWHRWLRHDVGARNAHFQLEGGEVFIVVALEDMPRFATELCEWGRHGKLIALAWYLRGR